MKKLSEWKFIRILHMVIISIMLYMSGFFTFFSIDVSAASNEQLLNETDRKNIETIIFEFAEQEGENFGSMTYMISDIYWSNEEWGGYIIEFFLQESEGYAIFFKIEESFKLIEIFFGRHSPFYGQKGLYIYPSLGCYYIKVDDVYIDAETLEPIADYKPTEEAIFYAACKKDKTNVEETINLFYTVGFLHQYNIEDFFVGYSTSMSDKSNNCANAAGLIMLNYWNKKYDNDILKLDSSLLSYSGNISYNSTRDARKDYMDKFYDYMHTNWLFGKFGGTLPEKCYDGFERLISENSYQTTTKGIKDYDQVMEFIDAGVPVFITSDDYYFTQKSTLPEGEHPRGSYTLSITYNHSSGLANSHTFVGYGYAYYNLYETGGPNYKQERLIKIADGWGGSRYYNFDRSETFQMAVINVYK